MINIIKIRPKKTFRDYLGEVWASRELIFVLASRDIAVRYKQTVIGVLWTILQPLLTLIIFTIIFEKVAKLTTGSDLPYGLMVYCALLPWQFFSTSLSSSTSSLIDNANLITKVYFPRAIIPLAAIAVPIVDLLINFIVLIGLLIIYKFVPSWHIIFLPIFIVFVFLASMGPGLFLSALNVKYRDFKFVIPFVLQLGLYVSPIGFSIESIPLEWRLVYFLNPMVGVIDGFRWSILGTDMYQHGQGILLSALVVSFFLVLGILQFKRSEKSLADNI